MGLLSTFSSVITGVGILKEVETSHNERIARYRKAYRFYEADIYDKQKTVSDTWAKQNYIRRFVSTHAEVLMREGIKFSIEDDDETQTDESTDNTFVLRAIEHAWRMNNRSTVLSEMATYGALTGDVFVRLSWKAADDDVGAHDSLYAEEAPSGHVRIDVLPPQFVFPEYSGHEDKTKGFTSVWIIAPYDWSNRRYDTLSELLMRPKSLDGLFIEHWTNKQVTRWDGATRVVTDNPFGFIPVVHINNYTRANSRFGISDIEDALDTSYHYNVHMTEASDILAYHASPTTVITGAAMDSVERATNTVWSVPDPEARVYNLEMKGDGYEAAEKLMNREYRALHEMASLPVGILGSLETGNSAVATVLKFQPMMSRRSIKVMLFTEGLELINRMILHILRGADSDFSTNFNRLNPKTRYKTKVTFPSTMPREETAELERSARRLQLGISSRLEEMLQRYGYSRSEAERVINQHLEDRAQDADVERLRVQAAGLPANLRPAPASAGDGNPVTPDEQIIPDPQINRSGNPMPNRPSPESQGEATSRQREPR